jgi:N utilization substance protein B
MALQILFQLEFSPRANVHELLNLIGDNLPKDSVAYAESLVEGVKAQKRDVDTTIQSASSHWKLDRMATVDRNLLRLACYEMKFSPDQIKPSIVINEAVEIAKIFGTTESASFVNGVLDQIAQDLNR